MIPRAIATAALALIAVPALALASPLHGNSNDNFYIPGTGSAGCQPIDDLTITIDVTKDIISDDGFGFQLNGASPPGAYQGFQQFVFSLTSNPICIDCQPLTYQLHAVTEPWPGPGANHTVKGNIANHWSNDAPVFVSPTIRAGSRFIIKLETNDQHNVSKVTYEAYDPEGTRQINDVVTMADLPPGGHQGGTKIGKQALSPLVVFQLVLVGPTNGLRTYLSSGAGTITYASSAASRFAHTTSIPTGCSDTGTSTLENSNSTYTAPTLGSGSAYTQSFAIASGTAFTPGGELAALRGNDGLNHVYAVDAGEQLTETAVTSTGAWSRTVAGVSAVLMAGGNGLVTLPDHGGQSTILSAEQGGGAVAYQIKADGKFDQATKLEPRGGLARFNGKVAAVQRSGVHDTRDLFAIENVKLADGTKVAEISLTEDAGQGWGSSVQITPKPTQLEQGGPLVASPRFGVADETDVFAINQNGRLVYMSATGSAAWTGPNNLSAKGRLSPSAELAVIEEVDAPGQTDVLSIDGDGDLTVFTSAAGQKWSTGKKVHASGDLKHGGHLAASPDYGTSGRTDVFTFDKARTLEVYSIDRPGHWREPHKIPAATAPAGAALVAMQDASVATQTDVFYIDTQGKPEMVWSAGDDWKGPNAVTEPCMPGYTLEGSTCARNCSASGTKLASDGTCACVTGTTRSWNGSCSTCQPDQFRDAAGNCLRVCETTHSVSTPGPCGCEPGYKLDEGGICSKCAAGYVPVGRECVPPADVKAAECRTAGGIWDVGGAGRCLDSTEHLPAGE